MRRLLTRLADIGVVVLPLLVFAGLVAAYLALVGLREIVPPKQLAMAAGSAGGGYDAYAQQYREILARDGITLHILETAGSVENARLLADGTADVALLQGGIPVAPGAGVEALAAITLEPFLIFHRSDLADGADPNAWPDLRVAIGEPGSGRQAVARAIHHAGSAGKSSLAQIACPVTGAEMLQAAVKAFLRRREELKEESVGTILLSDFDQLPGDAQHELAGFLSLPDMRLRLIGTSRRPLTELAAEGSFGWQLAYRLSTITIRLPSLRERRSDIPLLAQHYLEQAGNDKSTSPHDGFTSEALDLLTAYDWPGNLPQLADAVRQACEGSAELLLPAESLPEFLHRAEESAKRTDREWEPIKLDAFLEEIETDLIKEALKHCSGNKTQAAKLLGVSRARLIRRVRQLGLEPGIDFEEIED